jgi:hypothetical protein
VEARSTIPVYDHTAVATIFHPLLALIASAADRQLARHVEFLKEENKIPPEPSAQPGAYEAR